MTWGEAAGTPIYTAASETTEKVTESFSTAVDSVSTWWDGFISKEDGQDGKPTLEEFIWICVGCTFVFCGIFGLPTVMITSLTIFVVLAVILVPLVLILLVLSSTFLAAPILTFAIPTLLLPLSPFLAIVGCFIYSYRNSTSYRQKKPKKTKGQVFE